MSEFAGHVAVVTGAASGIGLGAAHQFAQAGAAVALLDQDAAQGQSAASAIRASGGVCESFSVDVSVESEVMATVQQISRRFSKVDHLINNAGVVLAKPLEECTVSEWDRVMDVNVKSIFLLAKHLLPLLRLSPCATMVNVGSVSSFVGQKHTPIYVASKGAVAMLSKSLALDFAEYGIRVNCVCPGITDTPMLRYHINQSADPERTLRERQNRVPLNRLLSPADIAGAILFLSGSHSAGVTGTTLVVDGGYLAAAEWANA